MAPGAETEELVVLVDDDGFALGAIPKRTAHHQATPLHLAFSCYVFDGDGRLLLTRRALHKPTWPGVWTNSFCGHPAPGEDMVAAVRRRATQELGATLTSLELVLPRFRYQATMANGVRENELCPVFVATTAEPVRPDPAEVDDTEWVAWETFRREVIDGSRPVSPWCIEQVAALSGVEGEPGRFAAASYDELPPAARAAPTTPGQAGLATPS
ncbi:MAG: isopentenyl-diphosphate Delta-isomerase [Nocardioides sp.]